MFRYRLHNNYHGLRPILFNVRKVSLRSKLQLHCCLFLKFNLCTVRSLLFYKRKNFYPQWVKNSRWLSSNMPSKLCLWPLVYSTTNDRVSETLNEFALDQICRGWILKLIFQNFYANFKNPPSIRCGKQMLVCNNSIKWRQLLTLACFHITLCRGSFPFEITPFSSILF